VAKREITGQPANLEFSEISITTLVFCVPAEK
jgi:hypothetical protein